MEDKVLQKAMLEAVKVFEDAGYKVMKKDMTEDGSTASMFIFAIDPSKD